MRSNSNSSRGKRENGDEEEKKKHKHKRRFSGKCCGIILQIITFIVNGIIWVMAVSAFFFSMIIGLETDTISTLNSNVLDWTMSTPATIFLFYSVPMFVVATFGCFAIVSANFICVIIYIILLLLFTVFDVVMGISILGGSDSYLKFIQHLHQSINRYGDADTASVGIIPLNPTVYWDHLQRRGKCCGLYSYTDWKNTTMARKTFSLPDSCCNDLYYYDGCGQLLWRHPDHVGHTLSSIVHERGCLTIFPWFIQHDKYESIELLGRLLLILIVIAVIASVVLFILVMSKIFKAPTGLNNPDFADVPQDTTIHTGRNDKVHPETHSPGPNSYGDYDDRTERKISFEVGPTLIREREQSPPIQRRRSSGQRDHSPPNDRRRSFAQSDRSPPPPPDRQPRRISGQREEPRPTRIITRKSRDYY